MRAATVVCVGLIWGFIGTDATITTWSTPTALGNTVTAVRGVAPTDAATVIIAETWAVGGTVATVKVGGTTVTYAITDSTNTFGIYMSATNGIVYRKCTESLDYTRRSSYSVTIVATDAHDNSKGTLTLTININAAPVFTETRTCTCNIATAAAIGGTLNNDFSFTNGLLNTANALVQADVSCYRLTITATDGGAGTATAAATDTTTMVVNVAAAGTTTSCSCNGVAAIGASVMMIFSVIVAQFM